MFGPAKEINVPPSSPQEASSKKRKKQEGEDFLGKKGRQGWLGGQREKEEEAVHTGSSPLIRIHQQL